MSVTVDTAAGDQPGLVVRKLQQCCVVFNFDDPLADVKSKEVKRACLNELIAALNDTRGLLTEAVCIEIVHMVSSQMCSFVLSVVRHVNVLVVVVVVKIVPERVLVLFRARTLSLRSGLGTFFVPEPDHAKHFR